MTSALTKGVSKFRRGYFRRHREKFENLVRHGQNPGALFITCADSRILPHALTHTAPGDLFVLRNVGNMVPAWAPGAECPAVGSAVEYAIGVLGVSHIVVCGHSHCGACAALYDDELGPELAMTARWLEQGARVKELILEKAALDEGGLDGVLQSREKKAHILRATEKAMVVQHLRNLLTYPGVAPRVEKGELALHGWHYALESGAIESYDPERLAFVPLDRIEPAQRPALLS
jgi:carbonic anhydrase